jgi:hypothetical protein
VRVRGDVVRQPGAHHLDGGRPHGPPEAALERPRGDRAKHAALHDPREAVQVVDERRRALGVREHDRVAAQLELEEAVLEHVCQMRVRALDQQVAAAAQGQRPQHGVVQLQGVGHRDLAARQHLHRLPGGAQRGVQIAHPVRQLARVERVVVADVRRGDDPRHAVRRGHLGHRQARLDVRRAVVEPRQDVAVEVDHRRGG